MIQHGAEKIINTGQSMMIDDDIDEIIKRGEEKTADLNKKYQGLDLDALNNFKSESMVNTWEGEDYANKVSTGLLIGRTASVTQCRSLTTSVARV